ncbi:MAG: diacylglycerol kinase family lipid kinase [Planctomycetota bacterium]|nr:diacylglycerol kinase family lipid kinase [Planctomycetota bacterium]MDA1113090.1 diacylglycerol kinase family lipid kinase [Planctomycetota bacterium]
MPSSIPRATFVVNAHAAGGRTGKRWAACEPKMREAFPTGEIQFTQGVGDGARIAREAVLRGQELIVAVGGDGTLFEVINGMLGGRVSGMVDHSGPAAPVLGIWPAGSGADFARGQGVPNDADAICELITTGTPRTVDVGRVQCVSAAGEAMEKYFLNAADFGIGAKVVERLQKRSRLLSGKSSYLWQTLRTLVTFKNPKVTMEIDGEAVGPKTILTVVVANSRYFGGGMCIAPAAKIDDGLLNLVQVGDLGRIEAMRRLQETFGGERIDHPNVHYSTCKIIRAESPSRVPIEADGELIGFLPASFEIIPHSLKILLP